MAKFSHVQFPNGDIHDVVGTDVVDQQNIKSGSLVNFSTNVALPLTELTSTIVTQGGGGTPSTPIPISGVSSVGFYQRGVNLWDEEWEEGSIIASGNTPSTTSIRTVGYIAVAPNATLYIKTPNMVYIWQYDKNKDVIGTTATGKTNSTITLDSETYFIRFRTDSSYGTTYGNDISINYPSTDTNYHAYNTNSDTFTISLGQTVYGGELDVINGKATITHQIVDLGEKTWLYNETRHYFTTLVPGIKRPLSTMVAAGGISSIFVPASAYKIVSEIDDDEFAVSSSSDTLMIRCTTYTDKDTFKTAMQNANAQLVYELATPIEIDITANNFTTIAGENNIFSDCGEVTVKYFAGTNVNKAIDDISELKINAHHDAFGALTDTDISSPSNGQIVKYNGTKWVNADNSANGVAVDGTTMQIQNTTVQKFLDVLYDALKDTTVELTASGSIANFATSLAKPLTELTSTIVAQQAGSGTPSPSNPRSISGFSSVKFGQVSDYATSFNGLLVGTHNVFTFSGSETWSYNSSNAFFYTTINTWRDAKQQTGIIANNKINLRIVAESQYANIIRIYVSENSEYISSSTDMNTIMTSATQFIYELATPTTPTITAEQFATLCTAFGITGETKTIALPETIYGGSVDCIGGTATVNKALIVFDGSEDEGWVYNSNYNGFSIPISDMVSGNQLNGLCNWLEQVNSSASFGFRLGANNRALYCYHITDNVSGVTDLASWKTYLSNNNLQIVFPLNTPIEITGLTPANFTTIAGEQNIFSDCGEVTVGFKQSIQEYIDSKIAETQA